MRVTRRPPAGLRSLLLAVSVAAALGACSLAETSPAAHLEGLLVLAGDTSGATLQTWAADAHADEGRDVATPDGTAWVAAGRADVLVAGLTDGSLQTSDPVDAAGDPDLAWRTVKAAGADGDEVPGPFYFPSWDPEGGRFATLAGDLDAEPRLTLVDPTTQSGFEIELGRPVIAAPPVWVGPDLVAVVVGTDAAPGSILVDTTTGEATDGPTGARLLASSADGRTVAVAGDEGDPVVIRSTAAWLGDDESSIGSIDPPDGVVTASALALDATGSRLAIVWLGKDGTPRVAVHERDAGWRRVAEPDVRDAQGAVVAWLR